MINKLLGITNKTVQHVTLQMLACEKLKVFFQHNYLKKPLATQISRSNACRLLSLGSIEGQSVQKYTPHNRTTQRRSTPRGSSRQRRHFGKSIPEFGETHSSVLGCERGPVLASVMSRSCFASFPVCVYKFSSHYLNNIIFYRQQFGTSRDRIIPYNGIYVRVTCSCTLGSNVNTPIPSNKISCVRQEHTLHSNKTHTYVHNKSLMQWLPGSSLRIKSSKV